MQWEFKTSEYHTLTQCASGKEVKLSLCLPISHKIPRFGHLGIRVLIQVLSNIWKWWKLPLHVWYHAVINATITIKHAQIVQFYWPHQYLSTVICHVPAQLTLTCSTQVMCMGSIALVLVLQLKSITCNLEIRCCSLLAVCLWCSCNDSNSWLCVAW